MASLARRVCGFVFLIALFAPPVVQAEMPPHLVLARPRASHHLVTPYSPPVRVVAQPYPYGYFGARPTAHWQRQYGIYHTYIQWSQK